MPSMIRKTLLLALGALSLSACEKPMTETKTEAPPAIDQLWQQAFNAGDGKALVALYARDAIVMPPGADMAKGIDAVAPVMTAHVGDGLVAAISPAETKVEGGLAWQVGTWVLKGKDGTEIDHGKFVQIWRKDPEGWRIARDIWNSSKVAG